MKTKMYIQPVSEIHPLQSVAVLCASGNKVGVMNTTWQESDVVIGN